ncbi:MAG TPA: CRISPR-associated helicase Cas3', partial [Polyangiaceae bacterium]
HAYDTYTSELLDRLVSWLSVLGSTVVILSATLPRRRRLQLIEAYGAIAQAAEAPYPRITAATRGEKALSLGTTPSRPEQVVAIEKVADDPGLLATRIADAVSLGGCAVWICNTVGRAQAAYEALAYLKSEGAIPEDTELSLLHSRFLRTDRQRLERSVEGLYGPGESHRPIRGILVGTQVLEQSLDLDFDLMITDLAPVDLVLQRVGRLHRHERARPSHHEQPRLLLVMPELQNGAPNFGRIAPVYEHDVMFRTWWELQAANEFHIPAEIENWIERVYGQAGTTPSDPTLATQLANAVEEASDSRRAAWNEAQGNLVFSPVHGFDEDRFGDTYADLQEDESGNVCPKLLARTRLAEPSLDVVCLWKTEDGFSLTRDGSELVDTERLPSLAEARAFMEHSIKIQNWRLAPYEQLVLEPVAWRKSAALRHKKVLLLGEAAECLGIVLDPNLGLKLGGIRG